MTYVSQDCAPAPAACDFTLVVESFFAGGVWGGAEEHAAPATGPAFATFQLDGNLSQVCPGREGKLLQCKHCHCRCCSGRARLSLHGTRTLR